MQKHFFLASFILLTSSVFSQETEEDVEPIETFQSTRIINGHSIEQLGKGVLEFRVEHRFGDIAGSNGGFQSMFGLDNSKDIRIAFEYGITDHLMIGLGRSKGARTPYASLIDGFAKYRILSQKKGEMPFSLGILGGINYTYMKASTDISQVSSFPKQIYRFSYATQLNIARKFHERFSMQLSPTLVHQNYVASDDINTLFSIGTGARIGLTGTIGIILEYYQNMHSSSIRSINHNSLSVAIEWITFGHNFTVYLTNSGGFGEVQFVANTQEDWLKGQFRLGFCIGRKFQR